MNVRNNSSLGQHFGRKMTLAIGETFIIIGALLQTTSYGLAQMIVGRIVTGFGMGHVTSTCPVWAVSFFTHESSH
jgi:MFS family permease